MLNTNLHPTSRRLQAIADYWSNFKFALSIGSIITSLNTLVRGELLNSLFNSAPRDLASINQ